MFRQRLWRDDHSRRVRPRQPGRSLPGDVGGRRGPAKQDPRTHEAKPDSHGDRRLPRGATILVIDVPEGLEVYSTSKGAYSRRWADTCRPMTPTEVSRLNDERRGNDWSAGPSGHGCDEADPLAIEIMRDLLRSTGDEARITLASRPSRHLLSALELVRDDGMLNRAGANTFNLGLLG